jgi:uncharacterized membrane protein YccC
LLRHTGPRAHRGGVTRQGLVLTYILSFVIGSPEDPPPLLLLLLLCTLTAYWATSVQGGVTRQGVVLTYLLSFVIGSQ